MKINLKDQKDVAIFCMTEGNVKSNKIKKNVSKFIQSLFPNIQYEDLEDEKLGDWKIDDFVRTISSKYERML